MYFVLGFLFAGLLGLMVLPALWRRAVRLSTRRLEMQTPLSMEEVLAERDLLRAEFAVCERRLEDRLTEAREAHARTRGDLGRHVVALAAREATLAEVRAALAGVEGELSRMSALAVDLQAQLGAALTEVYDASIAREQSHAAQEEAQKLKRMIGDRQVAMAGFEAQLATLEVRERELMRELSERDKLLTGRHALIERITEERDRARAEVQAYAQGQSEFRAKLDARERRIAEMDEAQADLTRKVASLERSLRQARRGAVLKETEAGDAELRRSISDLGADVLRIAAALEDEAKPERPKKLAAEATSR